ncbi:MAG: peptidoglycan DD-metalloendopeptidase family protein [Rhodocyclaceae bacterium]|nr:peptidoglycan DD-metalloendopeptidase family protein [Rhodocyclaceae bacterium]
MNLEKTRILTQLQAIRENRPYHFWAVAAVAVVSLFSMMAAFGTAPDSVEIRDYQRNVIEQLVVPIDITTESGSFVREERIQRGDSVASLLTRLGVQDEQAFAYLRQQTDAQAIFRQLRPGKIVTVRTSDSGELLSLTFPLNGPKDNALVVEKRDDKLIVSEQAQQLNSQVVMKAGEIRNSLFAATDAIGLPDGIATQMADIFGGDIDFHRDLRKGDRFSVVYEMLYNQGHPARTGRILAAEFANNGKTFRALWFEGKDGQGYYTADGKSIRKAFLRSPLEFSRITSGFSISRFHPILQTWRAHKGVDYGAPVGTRVKATGDGTVEFAGKQGGYGNLVVIRHQGRFTTHYGHLNGFAAGMRKGTRVSQGDIIGYVGQTGWATGPHLHYEFRINDVHQNPLSVALPSAPPLASQQLAEFNRFAEPLVYRLDRIRGMNLAMID